MKQIEQKILEITDNYHAPGTKGAYQTGAKQWIQFCDIYHIQHHQYSEANIIKFLTWLYLNEKDGIKKETAKGKTYAIKEFAYQTYGEIIEVDRKNAFSIARFKQSLEYINPAGDGATPITMDKLRKLTIAAMKEQEPEWIKQTNKTLMIIAFSEMKRAGEYTLDKQNNRGFYHGDLFLKTDAKTQQNYLIWNRRTGKTYRAGSDEKPLQSAIVCKCKRWGKSECPYHNMMKLIIIKNKAGISTARNQPIFMYLKGKQRTLTPYNKYSAGDLLTRMVKTANLKDLDTTNTKYSLHGFRKGGAMQAVQDGMDITSTMKQADWRSAEMVIHYTRKTPIEMHANNVINIYK